MLSIHFLLTGTQGGVALRYFYRSYKLPLHENNPRIFVVFYTCNSQGSKYSQSVIKMACHHVYEQQKIFLMQLCDHFYNQTNFFEFACALVNFSTFDCSR